MASRIVFISLFILGAYSAPQRPSLQVRSRLIPKPVTSYAFNFNPSKAFIGTQFQPKTVSKARNVANPSKASTVVRGRNDALSHNLDDSPYRNPPSFNSGSIVWQTRQLAEYSKDMLRQFEKDPIAAPYLDRILAGSECITSIEDAIVVIDTSVRLLEDAEPEVLRLVSTAGFMQETSDIETLVRVSADIVRQLGKLVPKLAPKDPQICGSTPEVSFSVLEEVGAVLDDISNDDRIELTSSGRDELKTSGDVVRAVIGFVKDLGNSFNGLEKEKCVSDRDSNVRGISAIGEMLLSLANMFETFGGSEDAEGVRQQVQWLAKVETAVEKSEIFDFGSLDCERPGDTSLAADTIDEIADLIAEIGVENLARQLGVEALV